MQTDAREIEEHLRAASDAILLLLTETGQLERHKRLVPPGEARFDEIASSVRRVAQALAEFTELEETWAKIATDGRTDIESIEASQNTPELSTILAKTRDAASEGKYEQFKTAVKYDSTAKHPEWLG